MNVHDYKSRNITRAAIGFTAIWKGEIDCQTKSAAAIGQAVSHFDNINQLSIKMGETQLELWGRDNLRDCVHYISDGSLLLLVGSPVGDFSWSNIEEMLHRASYHSAFEIPWDGRAVIFKISPDGNQWTLWNDWLGSIPVFHTRMRQGRIASTLEPVVVAGAGLSPDNFFIPALVCLLIHGHFLGDWTLYKDMKVIPPDCIGEWDEEGFHWQQYNTVKASDDRWETGWDELVDEMYTLSRQAIAQVLQTQSAWILPLSSGLDSRLIAAVAAELGVKCNTYTWGSSYTSDVIYAKQIANALGLPWKRVDLGTEYLAKYAQLWADLFGSAMHFHGMYQMPFLDSLKTELSGPIVSGFIGDGNAGYSVRFSSELHSSNSRSYQTCPDGYLHWLVKDIPGLMRIQTNEALDEIASEINRSINAVPGPWFQRLRFLSFWGRQRHFTYFQSMLSDYWRGVGTPFLNRDYARFCLSLPRCVLDDRRLLGEVFKRYYPKVVAIPGSYKGAPYYTTVRYVVKRRFAQLLERTPLQGSLQLINTRRLETDIDCIKNNGWDSFWPVSETMDQLRKWIDVNQLENVYNTALGGDMQSVRKLQSIQTIAYRLLDT